MSQICIPIPTTKVIGVTGANGSPDTNVVANRPDITALTGGTSTDLDSLKTNPITATSLVYGVGSSVFVVISGVPAIYQLSNSSANNPPSSVRPADYDAAAAKAWIQRM